ncbi:hypothetical protein N9985_02655 [Gammaproteobacteria bacterium]|nr:hypothetical protein [Gammaproteobacteria bacterium]
MHKPLAKELHPGLVELQLRGSTAPGLGWNTYTALVPKGQKTELWSSPDLDEDPPERIAELDWPLTWRNAATYFAYGEEYVVSGNLAHLPSVTGMDGLGAEVLLLSWTHDGEPALNELAQALLSLDDDNLASLHTEYGSFLNNKFANDLHHLMSYADELDIDSVINLFDRARNETTDVSLDYLLSRLPDWIIQYEQETDAQLKEAASLREERAEALAPYRQNIDELIEKIFGRAPGHAQRRAYYYSNARPVVKHIEDYVLQHGKLPSEKHQFGVVHTYGGRETDLGTIDFADYQ